MRHKFVAITVLAFGFIGLGLRLGAQGNQDWTRPFPPFKVIGNIYWVGTYDLSTYLITTPQGHILINTGLAESAPGIKAGIEKLGFKLSDVKILTATHGHFDHVAAIAELKKMSGASVVINERDKDLLETGGAADFRFGDTPSARFPAVKVDRTFKGGDKITLGETTLTAHLHAGHTKGATSFSTDVQENGKTYRVVIANMGSINPGVTVTGMPKYPEIKDDYARTFKSQKATQVDVFLSSHASQFRLHEKYKPGDPYDPNRFVDPAGFLKTVSALEAAYVAQVAKEQAAKE
jgi:metallo-beta-lactamase class B